MVVQALVAAGYEVFATNPRVADRYRDRHALSGAKSDALDARVLADIVRTDRHNHRPVAGDSDAAEELKMLARGHQNLIWSRTRHVLQLRSVLLEYFPRWSPLPTATWGPEMRSPCSASRRIPLRRDV